MLVSLLLLLTACPTTNSPVVADPDTNPDTNTDTSESVLLLADALECGTPGQAGGVVDGKGLIRVDLDLEQYPEALCNDGSGAIMYVRRYSDDALKDRWVIRVQGGGSCKSGEECADRWCNEGTSFGMDKMTSTLAPELGIISPGVHAEKVENPMAGANHALLYYCSSDSWAGQGEAVLSETADGTEYNIHFHGADIFEAAIDTLRSGVTYTDPDQIERSMPDLDQATEVLFAGASAGAAGVTNNLDSLAEILPGASVAGLHDSNFAPTLSELDLSTSSICTDYGACDFNTYIALVWDTSFKGYWNGRVDSSCLSAHPEEPGLCVDVHHVVTNHLTTPVFVRMDLQDSLIMGNMVEGNFSLQSGAILDEVAFAELVTTQLQALQDVPNTAEETVAKAPGYFGPACGKHETLGNNDAVYATTVSVNGVDATMFQLMGNWLLDQQPQGGVTATLGEGCP